MAAPELPDISGLPPAVRAFYSEGVHPLTVTLNDAYGGPAREFTVAYKVAEGSGKRDDVLVCIHGFPTCMYDWHKLWDRLKTRFGLVVAVDQLGFGISDKPAFFGYSFAAQADICEAVLRTLGVRAAHILNHDYGVSITQELLARSNARGKGNAAADEKGFHVRSAVFLNGGLFPESHQPRLIQKLLAMPGIGRALAYMTTRATFARSFAAVFGPSTQPSEGELDEFWALASFRDGSWAVPDIIAYMAERREKRERFVGALLEAKVPIRVINGPADPVSGAHLAARFKEVIPNADVVSLAPHIGHYPQIEDDEGVWAAFVEFHDTRAKSA